MNGSALAWDSGAALRWPHRSASRFVIAGGLRWHVQQMGPQAHAHAHAQAPDAGPVLLLVHGTGASTHSWRSLMPLLARDFTVVAMDLPGHAFSGSLPADQQSLPGMARAVAALVEALALDVCVLVGHSAGAAIAARMVLDGCFARSAPARLVALNGAFLPFNGLAGLLFPPVARLMAATPLASNWFSRRDWNDAALRRLIGGTGSVLDDEGLALYGTLLRDARHTAGALGMMSRWDLRPLQQALPQLRTPLTLVVGANDRAVPPADAARVCRLLRPPATCHVHTVSDAGHLVHEERPEVVARLIVQAARAVG